MTRRDWWIGIVLVALALLVHALVPRYEYQLVPSAGTTFARIDRWTGAAEAVSLIRPERDFDWDRLQDRGVRELNP